MPEFQVPERGLGERVRRLPIVRHFPVVGKKDDPDDLPPHDRFALPDVPLDWQPENISKAAAAAAIIEAAKRTPGMPDPNILENYHTQPEIEGLVRQENWDRHVQEVEIANKAIEDLTGRKIKNLTAAERNQACLDLKIDLALGTFIRPRQQQQQQLQGQGHQGAEARARGTGGAREVSDGGGGGRPRTPGSGIGQGRWSRANSRGQRGPANLRPYRTPNASQPATQESYIPKNSPTEPENGPPDNGSDLSSTQIPDEEEQGGFDPSPHFTGPSRNTRSQSLGVAPVTGRVVGGTMPDTGTQEQGGFGGTRGTHGQVLTPAGARAIERSMAPRPGIKRRGSRKRGQIGGDGGGGKRPRGM